MGFDVTKLKWVSSVLQCSAIVFTNSFFLFAFFYRAKESSHGLIMGAFLRTTQLVTFPDSQRGKAKGLGNIGN